MTKNYRKIISILIIFALVMTTIGFAETLDETVPPSTDQVDMQEEIDIPNYDDLTVTSDDTTDNTGSTNDSSSSSSSGSSNTSDDEADNENDLASEETFVLEAPVAPENLASELDEAQSAEEATAIIESVSTSLSQAIDEGVNEKTQAQVENLTNQVSQILESDFIDSEKSNEIVKKIIDENLSKINQEATTTKKDKAELRKIATRLANKAVEKSGQIDLEEGETINPQAVKEALAAVNKTAKLMKETLENNQLQATGKEMIEKKVTIKGDGNALSLDLNTIETLNKASMGLTVQSNGMALDLDANTLKTLGKKSIEVKSEPMSDLSNTVLQEKAGSDYRVLKTNDLDISTKDGDGSLEQVANIKIKIDVSDYKGNKDYLSIIIYNEETETFEKVKSWVVDGQLVLKTPHYSLYSVAEYKNQFEDINDHWCKDKIVKMTAKGITDGYSDGIFNPNGNITRGEFVKLLVVAFDLESQGKNIFTDVHAEDWYYPYVQIALKNGLLNDMIRIDGRSFHPSEEITREDIMILMASLYTLETGEDLKTEEMYFEDLSSATRIGQQSINGAMALDLIDGYDDGRFKPQGKATRAEAIKILDDFISFVK